jgi:hypothetical protein
MEGRGALALGLAGAAGAALALPVGSAADRELAGVMVVRLLAYVWVAVIVGRQERRMACAAAAAIAAGAVAAGAVAAGALPWRGQAAGLGVP